jgi:hypothetical protein
MANKTYYKHNTDLREAYKILLIDNGDDTYSEKIYIISPGISDAIKLSPTGGAKAVAAAGTAVPLVASETNAQSLYVKAREGNTGSIFFGDSDVDKDASPQAVLFQGQSISVSAESGYKLDVNEFYIDADNNDDGVDFIYL